MMMHRLIVTTTVLAAVCSFGAANLEQDINVRDFGAKGDGVTDDSAAFVAAGKALNDRARPMAKRWGNRNRSEPSGSIEGPRPRIVVPAGKYLIKNTAVLYSDIILEGRDGAELIGSDPQQDIFYFLGSYRVRLVNLTFRGGRHSIFAETQNKESANFRITRCKFYDSADIAFHSPSLRTEKGPLAAWYFDKNEKVYKQNPNYNDPKRYGNNHSSMIVIDNCQFENCNGCISMCPDGSVVRNSSFVMPRGSTNAVFYSSNLMHAYALKIVHYAGSAAFRSRGGMRLWIEDADITTADGSGAKVVEGSFGNSEQASDLVLSDVRTDAGLAKNNAIFHFTGKYPAIAALVRVTAEGPNEVKAFDFGSKVDHEAFYTSTRKGIIDMWPPDRFYSYGMRDCSANIRPIEEGNYAKRFERPVPEWAAAPSGMKCRFEIPKLEKAQYTVYPGTWQIETWTKEIKRDTIIDARGVAAFAGMTSDRPWFVVKKGARAIFRNLQVRGGKNFIVVEDGAEAYVDTCFSYDAEGATFVCQKGGKLFVDNGVYYAAQLYNGEGDAFIRSIWYRFTETVEQGAEFKPDASMVNHGRLLVWDLLGVPTVFGRFGRDFASSKPTSDKPIDIRWVDNYGTFRSRMMRYGGEWGGMLPAWNHADGSFTMEGSYSWYWNRSVPNTPIMCDRPDSNVKAFAVNFSPYRMHLSRIELLYRDQDGKEKPCNNPGLQLTCPTAEPFN